MLCQSIYNIMPVWLFERKKQQTCSVFPRRWKVVKKMALLETCRWAVVWATAVRWEQKLGRCMSHHGINRKRKVGWYNLMGLLNGKWAAVSRSPHTSGPDPLLALAGHSPSPSSGSGRLVHPPAAAGARPRSPLSVSVHGSLHLRLPLFLLGCDYR
jgi:hypothetical protein